MGSFFSVTGISSSSLCRRRLSSEQNIERKVPESSLVFNIRSTSYAPLLLAETSRSLCWPLRMYSCYLLSLKKKAYRTAPLAGGCGTVTELRMIHHDKSKPLHWANWACRGGTNLLILPFGCLMLLSEDLGNLLAPLGMLCDQRYMGSMCVRNKSVSVRLDPMQREY